MSKTYSDLYYTSFPDEPSDSYEYMQDLTADNYVLARQYNTFVNQGKYNEASQLLIDNPTLNRAMFNAEKYNKLIDSVKAIQRLYASDLRSYIMNVVVNRGEYSSVAIYNKYNIVYYEGNAYMNVASNTPMDTLPTDTNYWYKLTIKGDKGESGLGLAPCGIWNRTTTYYKDDCVMYQNILWAATEENINVVPENNSAIWYPILSQNILLSAMKVTDEEIDAIFNGTAEFTDNNVIIGGEAGGSASVNESITTEDIDKVLNS
jgi:hypothetical protein